MSVIESRQMLRWAFVALYFLNNEKSAATEGELYLFKYQLGLLERETERTHGTLVSDLTPFMNPNEPDSKPFYHFKDKLLSEHKTLKKMVKNFTDAIMKKT